MDIFCNNCHIGIRNIYIGTKMRKIILTVVMVTSLSTMSFAQGLHQINSFSNSSFPPPSLSLAS